MARDEHPSDDGPAPTVSPESVRAPSSRTPGFDVARALAILGMILVNFRGKMEAYDAAWPPVEWWSDRIEGKAAALFVVLAGVGVSLRVRRALITRGAALTREKKDLFTRAVVLLVVGLLNLHLWDWDILHCYGVYLAVAALLLGARSAVLWGLVALVMAVQVALYLTLDWYTRPALWTAPGFASEVLFSGNHAFFPWFGFLLVGMWLGRRDLRDPATRRRLLLVSLVAFAVVETLDALARPDDGTPIVDWTHGEWLRTWPRPPRPLFVVSGASLSIATICLCIEVTAPRANARWVVALVATGQLALTIYLAHAVAILIPLEHGWLYGAWLEVSIAYSLAFYGLAIAASLWWRRRFPYGPLELLMRQINDRTQPGPWGGDPLAR